MINNKSNNQTTLIAQLGEELGNNIKQPIYEHFLGHTIRFDMEGERNNIKNLQTKYSLCTERAKAIFNFLFHETTELTVYLEFYSRVRSTDFQHNPLELEEMRIFEVAGLKIPFLKLQSQEVLIQEEEPPHEQNGYFYEYRYSIQAYYDHIEALILSVAGNEIGLSELPTLLFYLVDLKRKIIFHLYDDRGLDVACYSKELKKALFHEFKDWILLNNYDEIEQSIS